MQDVVGQKYVSPAGVHVVCCVYSSSRSLARDSCHSQPHDQLYHFGRQVGLDLILEHDTSFLPVRL